jgi:hypothetical protein
MTGRDGNAAILEYRQTDQDSGVHAYNCAESPLDLLLKKGIIQAYQHLAGGTFRRDWEALTIGASRSAEMCERVQGGYPRNTLTDRQCQAQERVRRAITAISPVGAIIIRSLCGEGMTLRDIAARYGWSPHYVGPRAREALDELAVHYGLADRRDLPPRKT